MTDVQRTNGIPCCPNCKTGTLRVCLTQKSVGDAMRVFNSKDSEVAAMRKEDSRWRCGGCDQTFAVRGDMREGYAYVKD